MNIARKLISAIVLFIAHTGSSDTLEMTCAVSSPALQTKCNFPEMVVDTPLTFQGKKISTKFEVIYSFACSGHKISLGLGSLDGRVLLEMGGSNIMVYVVSDKSISIKDSDATGTKEKLFKPGCAVEVVSKSKYPSNSAINSLTDQARLLVKVINRDMQLVQLTTAFAEISNLTAEEYSRLRDMSWDYLDFAIENAGIDEGVSYFSVKDYEIFSVNEMEARDILTEWEDLADEYPTIDDLASVLNFALQNLDTAIPVPSPLESKLAISAQDELSKYYNRELRKSIRRAKRFLSSIHEFVDHMNEENKQIIESLRSKTQ